MTSAVSVVRLKVLAGLVAPTEGDVSIDGISPQPSR